MSEWTGIYHPGSRTMIGASVRLRRALDVLFERAFHTMAFCRWLNNRLDRRKA